MNDVAIDAFHPVSKASEAANIRQLIREGRYDLAVKELANNLARGGQEHGLGRTLFELGFEVRNGELWCQGKSLRHLYCPDQEKIAQCPDYRPMDARLIAAMMLVQDLICSGSPPGSAIVPSPSELPDGTTHWYFVWEATDTGFRERCYKFEGTHEEFGDFLSRLAGDRDGTETGQRDLWKPILLSASLSPEDILQAAIETLRESRGYSDPILESSFLRALELDIRNFDDRVASDERLAAHYEELIWSYIKHQQDPGAALLALADQLVDQLSKGRFDLDRSVEHFTGISNFRPRSFDEELVHSLLRAEQLLLQVPSPLYVTIPIPSRDPRTEPHRVEVRQRQPDGSPYLRIFEFYGSLEEFELLIAALKAERTRSDRDLYDPQPNFLNPFSPRLFLSAAELALEGREDAYSRLATIRAQTELNEIDTNTNWERALQIAHLISDMLSVHSESPLPVESLARIVLTLHELRGLDLEAVLQAFSDPTSELVEQIQDSRVETVKDLLLTLLESQESGRVRAKIPAIDPALEVRKFEHAVAQGKTMLHLDPSRGCVVVPVPPTDIHDGQRKLCVLTLGPDGSIHEKIYDFNGTAEEYERLVAPTDQGQTSNREEQRKIEPVFISEDELNRLIATDRLVPNLSGETAQAVALEPSGRAATPDLRDAREQAEQTADQLIEALPERYRTADAREALVDALLEAISAGEVDPALAQEVLSRRYEVSNEQDLLEFLRAEYPELNEVLVPALEDLDRRATEVEHSLGSDELVESEIADDPELETQVNVEQAVHLAPVGDTAASKLREDQKRAELIADQVFDALPEHYDTAAARKALVHALLKASSVGELNLKQAQDALSSRVEVSANVDSNTQDLLEFLRTEYPTLIEVLEIVREELDRQATGDELSPSSDDRISGKLEVADEDRLVDKVQASQTDEDSAQTQDEPITAEMSLDDLVEVADSDNTELEIEERASADPVAEAVDDDLSDWRYGDDDVVKVEEAFALLDEFRAKDIEERRVDAEQRLEEYLSSAAERGQRERDLRQVEEETREALLEQLRQEIFSFVQGAQDQDYAAINTAPSLELSTDTEQIFAALTPAEFAEILVSSIPARETELSEQELIRLHSADPGAVLLEIQARSAGADSIDREVTISDPETMAESYRAESAPVESSEQRLVIEVEDAPRHGEPVTIDTAQFYQEPQSEAVVSVFERSEGYSAEVIAIDGDGLALQRSEREPVEFSDDSGRSEEIEQVADLTIAADPDAARAADDPTAQAEDASPVADDLSAEQAPHETVTQHLQPAAWDQELPPAFTSNDLEPSSESGTLLGTELDRREDQQPFWHSDSYETDAYEAAERDGSSTAARRSSRKRAGRARGSQRVAQLRRRRMKLLEFLRREAARREIDFELLMLQTRPLLKTDLYIESLIFGLLDQIGVDPVSRLRLLGEFGINAAEELRLRAVLAPLLPQAATPTAETDEDPQQIKSMPTTAVHAAEDEGAEDRTTDGTELDSTINPEALSPFPPAEPLEPRTGSARKPNPPASPDNSASQA